MKRRSRRWMAPLLRGAVSVLLRPTVTARSPFPRLTRQSGRGIRRVVRLKESPAPVFGADDRPIFLSGPRLALVLGTYVCPLPCLHGWGWRELPVFTGREVQRVGSCPTADRPTIVSGLAFTNQFRSLPRGG